MKKYFLLLMAVAVMFSCKENKQEAIEANVNAEKVADAVAPAEEKAADRLSNQYAGVALNFINGYKQDCDNLNDRKDTLFVEESPYVTSGFKSELKRIMEEAEKEDPEMGLGFDPIFDAQDYPDQGFEIKSVDEKTGYVVVQGKDWKEFLLTMQVVNENGKWLVNGCGIINIPQDKRRKDYEN